MPAAPASRQRRAQCFKLGTPTRRVFRSVATLFKLTESRVGMTPTLVSTSRRAAHGSNVLARGCARNARGSNVLARGCARNARGSNVLARGCARKTRDSNVLARDCARKTRGLNVLARNRHAPCRFLPLRRGIRARRETVHMRAHEDRKSTRLNSSHVRISYAVFCLKKKKKKIKIIIQKKKKKKKKNKKKNKKQS